VLFFLRRFFVNNVIFDALLYVLQLLAIEFQSHLISLPERERRRTFSNCCDDSRESVGMMMQVDVAKTNRKEKYPRYVGTSINCPHSQVLYCHHLLALVPGATLFHCQVM
jgi:hypothetical protein